MVTTLFGNQDREGALKTFMKNVSLRAAGILLWVSAATTQPVLADGTAGSAIGSRDGRADTSGASSASADRTASAPPSGTSTGTTADAGAGGVAATGGTSATGTAASSASPSDAGGHSSGNGTVASADAARSSDGSPARYVAADEDEDASLPALDQSVIKDVIVSHMPAIKYCYNQELKKDPDLAGKVVIKFTVGPKGTVTRTEVKETTLKNKDVESCMVTEIKAWIFPEPRRGESVDIAFPFVFKPST